MNRPSVAPDQIWTYRRRSYRIIAVDDTWTRLRRCIAETGEFDRNAREFAVETAEFRVRDDLCRYFYSGRYVGNQKEPA